MTEQLSGKTIAFVVAPEGVEQVELTEPWKAVEQAGGTPKLVSTDSGKVQGFNHLDKADTFDVDVTIDQADVRQFDGLVLPGRRGQPRRAPARRGRRRVRPRLLRGRQARRGDLPRAVALVEADVVRDRTVTSWPSLQTDLRNAGAPGWTKRWSRTPTW